MNTNENTAKPNEPKSDTPRTDAVWAELTETTDILKFARTLERELEHVRKLLIESNSKNYPRVEEIQLIHELAAERAAKEQTTAALSEVARALDAAGCPIGNEHKTYDVVERIAGLHKSRDYAWRQMDKARAAKGQAEEALREIEIACGNPDPSDGGGTSPQDVVRSVGGLKKRAEQAEARLAGAIEFLKDIQNTFAFISLKYGARVAHLKVLELDKFLSAATPPPIVAERDALKIEYESRAAWIAEMNKILGYDNADGFHSEPSPHEIARQMKAELERLRAMEAHHKLFPVLDAKWLDPECHNGCQSLVFKHRAEAAEKERDGLREGFGALIKGTIAAKEKSNAELEKLRAKLELVKSVLSDIPSCDISSDAFMASMSSGAWCQWMDKRNKALAQLDTEQCSHDAAYYNPGADNFYCIHCKVGMGEAFHKVAKENMALEAENKSLRAAMSAEGGSK